jgi:hypothetical protein
MILPHTDSARQYSRTPKITPIFVYHRGRTICIGQVVGQRFVKHINASKHFLRNPPAICLDSKSVVDAERAGAAEAWIHDDESGHWYSVSLDTFKSKCFSVTRGDGRQLGLTLDHWSINGQQPEAQRRTEAEKAKAKRAAVEQLDLFGGLR